MKIVILQSIAGLADPTYDQPEFGYAPGQVLEVSEALAKAWIAGAIAAKAKKSDVVTADAQQLQPNLVPEA